MARIFLPMILAVGACLASWSASASCSDLPLQRTKPLVTNFMIRPEGLLDQYPYGSDALKTQIFLLVSSDPDTTLKPVLALLQKANHYQGESIGGGIGRAALQCDRARMPDQAKRLAEQPLLNKDRTAMPAFLLAYRGDAAALPSAAPVIDKPTNPLGMSYIGSPETSTSNRSHKLPDIFAPVR